MPMHGRFASPDPARDQHFELTQSWNIYSYARNSPTALIDPTGMVAGLIWETEWIHYDDGLLQDYKGMKESGFAKLETSQQRAQANTWRPEIKPLDRRVLTRDIDLFKNAVAFLNSPKHPLTEEQRKIFSRVTVIELFSDQELRPGMILKKGVFEVNVAEFRKSTIAWTASKIAHDA